MAKHTTYRISKSAESEEAVQQLFDEERQRVEKKLGASLPSPKHLEYLVEFEGVVGKSNANFTDARENVDLESGDAKYSLVADYDLSSSQRRKLSREPPRSALDRTPYDAGLDSVVRRIV